MLFMCLEYAYVCVCVRACGRVDLGIEIWSCVDVLTCMLTLRVGWCVLHQRGVLYMFVYVSPTPSVM